MTSSDNVLRLGLTPKPIYAELALRALDFHAALPPVGDAPFGVQVIGAAVEPPVQSDLLTGQFRLVLCLEGEVHIGDTTLLPGHAAVFTAVEPTVGIAAAGRCAIIRTKI